MLLKVLGALFIVLACGGVGFKIAGNYLKEEKQLRQLIYGLEYMNNELQYRLTPLPELCKQTSLELKGAVARVFLQLYNEMTAQIAPNVSHCMAAALSQIADISPQVKDVLNQLGSCLGRFDVDGQIRGINAVKAICNEKLSALTQNKDTRIRSYKTLGLCAGAAVVILFI